MAKRTGVLGRDRHSERIMVAMALYEYLCRDCETSFEVRRAMSDTDRRGDLSQWAHRRASETLDLRFRWGRELMPA